MPINLREASAALGGNHFTPARFLVPMTIKDPAERIVALGRAGARRSATSPRSPSPTRSPAS